MRTQRLVFVCMCYFTPWRISFKFWVCSLGFVIVDSEYGSLGIIVVSRWRIAFWRIIGGS
jgi:hypothetical protein